eukprot:756207-Hanusia_phi.AAC.1
MKMKVLCGANSTSSTIQGRGRGEGGGASAGRGSRHAPRQRGGEERRNQILKQKRGQKDIQREIKPIKRIGRKENSDNGTPEGVGKIGVSEVEEGIATTTERTEGEA